MPQLALRPLIGLLLLAALPALAAEPAFLTGPQAGEPMALAMNFLNARAASYGLSSSDLADLEVTDHYKTDKSGMTHVYLRQRHQGIPVHNGQIGIHVARNGAIIALNNGAISNLAGKLNTVSPKLSPEESLRSVANHLGLRLEQAPIQLVHLGGSTREARFAGDSLSLDEIPVSLMYQPLASGAVRLVWRSVVRHPNGSDWWEIRVDAETGEVLDKNNWYAHIEGCTSNEYSVIPVPAVDPLDVSEAQVNVCNPADGTASPFGWHDNNGAAGAEFTDTRGNNVHAQEDQDNNDTGGARPSGGASLLFNATWDPNLAPTGGTNIDASTTNLFYYNNVMHDITYQYGFNEAAGNFQTNNYGNPGLGNDHVFADSLDGSGTNNANFGTPPDGSNPRMQMFRWLYPYPNEVLINSPAPIAGSKRASSAAFGPALNPTGFTQDIVLAIDGAGVDVNDGCEALTNGAAMAGKIALINRGNCNFTVKVKNAQLVGAVAAIIKKITSGGPSAMGGTDATVTIPSVMISLADGNAIITELGSGPVNGTVRQLATTPLPDRDSDFDNGVIAHEYGHGISNRLVGGPANVACLTGTEQMGEGLSDFWTVVLSPTASDTASTIRSVGGYLTFDEIDFPVRQGPGIRAFPYSTNMTTNPLIYTNIDDGGVITVPHGVGTVWMSAVYEVYQELVAKHGLDLDLYAGNGGNNLMIQLMIDGMKLVACNPTFVSLRDAIILADQNTNAGANRCDIWRGFAKRGLGVAASTTNNQVGNEVADFTIPGDCRATPNYIFDDGFETGNTSRWTVAVP